MHLIEFPESNIKRYIPENLSECDSDQYVTISDLFIKFQQGLITMDEMLIESVYVLLNMKRSRKTKDWTNIVLLSELIKSTFFEEEKIILETGEEKTILKIVQNFINNPVEHFKPHLIKYYGPSDGFQNLKFGEYSDAFKVFIDFSKNGNIESLYELAAILYRPKKTFFTRFTTKYDGDIRQPYNPFKTEKRIELFKKLPLGYVYGVYLYFSSVQLFLNTAKIPYGDKTLDLSVLYQNNEKEKSDYDDIGLDSVLFSMAESGMFGTFDKVQQVPFWTIMVKMYDARIKELELEKRYEDANNKQTT